jgi:hypothetical protein
MDGVEDRNRCDDGPYRPAASRPSKMMMTRSPRDATQSYRWHSLIWSLRNSFSYFRRFNLCASVLPTSAFFFAVILDHIPGEPTSNFRTIASASVKPDAHAASARRGVELNATTVAAQS